jgi:PAS domain S-box-containing protein
MIKFLTLPEFEDKEITLKAQTFLKLVIGSAIIVTFIEVIELIVLPQNYLRWIFIICSFNIVSLGLLFLNRKRMTRVASYLFANLLIVLIFGLAWSGGGIKAAAIQGIPIVVLAVGLVLGWKEGAFYAAGTTVACIGLVVVESLGFLPVSKVVPTSLSVLANSTMQVGLLVLLQYLIVGNLNKALREAKDEVALRKQAEEALKTSESKLRAVLDNTHDAIGVHINGVWEMCNPAALRLFGISSPQELLGTSILEVIVPYERPRIDGFIRNRREGGEALVTYVTRGLRTDGTEFDMDVALSSFTLENKLHVLVVLRDITERKHAEESLQKSEERFRLILDNMPILLNVFDNEGMVIIWNKACEEATGYKADEIIGNPNAMKLLYPNPEYRAKVWNSSPDPDNKENVYDLMTKKGERRTIEWFDIYHRLKVPSWASWGMGQDITERKRAEEALRENEERYRALVTFSPDALYVHVDGRITLVNPALCQMLGADDPSQLIGKSVFEIVHPDYHEKVRERWKLINADNPAPLLEEKFIRIDGTSVDVEVRAVAVEGKGSRGMQVIARDITERKRAEEALRFERLLLRTLIDNIPDSIYSKDMSCRKTLANLAEVRNLRVHAEADVLGKDDFELYPKELADGFFADDQVVLQTGQPVLNRVEYIFDEKGEKRCLLTSKLPLRDKEGRTIGLVGIGRDITERQRAEDQLRKLSLAVEQSPVSIVITDIYGNIEYVNPKFSQVTGYTMEEVRGKNPRILKSGETSTEEYKRMWETITAGKAWIGEFHNKKKNGEFFWEMASISPVKNQDNVIVNFVAVKEDITMRKQVEEALRHAQKLESIGTLAGGIAHDFNNLLNAILGQSALAMNKIAKESPAKDHIEKSIKAAERAADLTRHLLAYSGKGKFVTEEIDLNRLVKENVQILEVSLPKTAQLLFDLGSPSPHIQGDVGQIQQIVMNLIINAGEAIASNPGYITVHSGRIVLTENDIEYWKYTNTPLQPGTYASLRVNDTGHGIKPEVLTRIFDPFFTTKFTGRGLGLAAVLGIVRGHQGGLRIESKEGKGTEFEVIFPLVDAPTTTGEPEMKAATVVDGGGKTVLVIDDELPILELLKDIFTDANFKVIEASNPMEGIELYRRNQHTVALVILDYSMPGMNGKEAFEDLVKINNDVMVMLCSGYAEEEIKSAFGDIHPQAFIQKPYKPAQLLETVSKILHKRI